MRRSRFAGLAIVLSTSLVGCNSGLAALFGSGNDDNNSNAPSSLSAFAVEASQQSPATVRFRVIDADGDAALVTLFYQLPGGATQQMTQLAGAENPQAYAGSPSGTEHVVSWDFAAEPDFPSDASYMAGVNVWAQLDGTSVIVLGANASLLGLGNDAPEVTNIQTPAGEGSGVIPIGLTLSDTSTDLVALRVEWQAVGDTQWNLARPGGTNSTPTHAISGLSAPPEGVSVNFFWDTGVDLPQLERDVQLRLTPNDPTVEGDPYLSDIFRVDNNAAPLLDLDNGLVVFGGDDKVGGIAIPFNVRDAEGDDVRVVFQWRTVGQAFPALPSDPAEVFAIQADPQLRAQYHVCSTRESWIEGRVFTVDETHVRLPEIGTAELPLSRNVLAGRPIEFLRNTEQPVEVTAAWSANDLAHVVAAVPVGDGLDALVLEEPGSASWRVRRVALADGTVGAELASGSGMPTALALDARETALFIGSLQGGAWQIQRLDLGTLELGDVASGPELFANGPRGIAALSAAEAVASVDNSLVRVRFADAGPVVTVVTTSLAEPWGVARDPFDEGAVLVAEHAADRVTSVRVADGARSVVLAPDPSPAPRELQRGFPAPRGIALDRGGERLLVATDDGVRRELRSLNRGSAYDLDGTGYATATAYVVCELPAAAGSSLAVGRHGLRLLTFESSDELLAIGGVEQRRTIASLQTNSNVVVLDRPLDPLVSNGKRWRLARAGMHYGSSTGGTDHSFAWDSRDVPTGAGVIFRAVPFDSEFGIDSQTSLERPLSAALGARRISFLDSDVDLRPEPHAVDFDGDGDLDVVVREGLAVSVFVQEGPGRFGATAVPLGIELGRSSQIPLLFADLDDDGLLDIAHCAIRTIEPVIPELEDGDPERWWRNVEIFYGTAPGVFETEPLVIEIDEARYRSIIYFGELQALDLNQDGALDLVMTRPASRVADSAGLDHEGLLLLERTAPRTYAPASVVAKLDEESIRAATVSFATDDIDGDGIRDFLCAQNGVTAGEEAEGGITVHFRSAQGDVGGEIVTLGELSVPEFPDFGLNTGGVRSVALADLDQDGDLDVIASLGSAGFTGPGYSVPSLVGVVAVYFQESPRVFSSEALVMGNSDLNQINRFSAGLTVADLNADGLHDVMTISDVGVTVHFATAPGVFGATPLSFLPSESFASSNREFPRTRPCDLDGDGDLDLLGQDVMSGEVYALLQVGAGIESLSSDPLIFELEGITDGSTFSEVVDLDADGDLDVIAANTGFGGNFSSNTLTLFEQIAPRFFTSIPQSLPADGSMLAPGPVTAADLDFDGDNEIVAISIGTNEVQVFYQDAPGIFADSLKLPGLVTPLELNSVFDHLGSLQITDLDLDGDLDILGAPNVQNRLVVYEQLPGGSFEALPSIDHVLESGIQAAGSPRGAQAADLDGDGVQELLFVAGDQSLSDDPETKETETYPELSQIVVFEGAGALGPDPQVTIHEPAGDAALVVCDVDGDGLLDLAAFGALDPDAAFGPRVLRVLYRTESGQYEEQQYAIPGAAAGSAAFLYGTARTIQFVDFDQDGDLDLATLEGGSSILSSTLKFHEQLAPRVFAAEPIMTGPSGKFMTIRDVDGDGELDATVTDYPFPIGGRTTISWGNQ